MVDKVTVNAPIAVCKRMDIYKSESEHCGGNHRVEIQRRAAVKGLTNAAVQTLATACLGMLNGQIPAVGNTLNIVCAAGLAANNWS